MSFTFTDGENIAGVPLRTPELAEGEYHAVIKEMKIVKNCKGKTGNADAIDIVYEIDYVVCPIDKKERIYITNYAPSKCATLLQQLYGDNIPQNIDLHEHIDRKCIVVIKHNTDSVGNIFANIVERKFI